MFSIARLCRVPVVPSVFAFIGLYAATLLGATDVAPLGAAIAIPLIWLSVVDFRQHIIPDMASAILAAIGLAASWWSAPGELFGELAVAEILLAGFWALGALYFRRRGREGLGIGDAKLIAAGVLVTGVEHIWLAILIASSGGITAALLERHRDSNTSRELEGAVPFGPFLAYGIYLTFLMKSVL